MKWLARVTCALTSSSVVSVVNNNTDKSNPGNVLVGRNRTARQEPAMYKKSEREAKTGDYTNQEAEQRKSKWKNS